ncbi:MAG TPA: hypothetical protein VNA23_00345 [Anaerolineales bacterium]|nr:hypothetical protein [Anaerolineales bacterium]
MLANFTDKLSQAILHTLTYSDIFDYPLTASEVHQYLTGVKASSEEVRQALEDGPIKRTGSYFTLPGRENIVSIRLDREARSQKLLPLALRYGRILGRLPYIRMVALTGSLAVMNSPETADFDYMLVAARGRVWTARAFALAFNRLTRLRGYTICPNLIVSEDALEWRLHDLYSARELCQMIPIAGMDVYYQLLAVNTWAQNFLPNAFDANVANLANNAKRKNSRNLPFRVIRVKALLELPLRGKFGDRFENWEMDRKIARFSKQTGFGEETIFNADVCQGNFHRHRSSTRDAFDKRLVNMGFAFQLPVALSVGADKAGRGSG